MYAKFRERYEPVYPADSTDGHADYTHGPQQPDPTPGTGRCCTEEKDLQVPALDIFQSVWQFTN